MLNHTRTRLRPSCRSRTHPRPGRARRRRRQRHDAAEPGHPSRRVGRRPRARARLRKPWLSPRRVRSHPTALRRQALDRLPASVSGLAPSAADAAGPVHGSSSSSTRRPHSPPGTVRARCAGVRTTTGSSQPGTSCIPARSAPTRSMLNSTSSASRRRGCRPGTRRRWTRSPTEPSSCATARPGSCWARNCSAGRPPVTPRAARDPCGSRRW